MSMTVESRDTQHFPRRQDGITVVGMLVWAIVVGILAIFALRIIPTTIEYFTIAKAINKVSAAGGSTVQQVRATFDRQKEIDHITSISGKDLAITKEGEEVVISFAYDSEIELFRPVYLLIKYEARSKAGKAY
jgi:hypothetical protein